MYAITNPKTQKIQTENHLIKPQKIGVFVLWSDETKLELSGLMDQQYIIGIMNHKMRSTLPTVNHGGGFVCSGTGNVQHVEGKMELVKY